MTDPRIDPEAQQRLTLRFGSEMAAWFEKLPSVLSALAQQWQFELGAPIPRGSVSVVFWCRMADGRYAVLKVSPDRERVAFEAAALKGWHTVHSPRVLALDQQYGALLLEAIVPGTPLVVTAIYPDLASVAQLLGALHSGVADPSYPTVGQRVDYLFASSSKLYSRYPDLAAWIPLELYERGHRLASDLAQDTSRTLLLHGDLTPSNILDDGEARGLVAIDPAPCLGDAAFDAVDLILWQADNLKVIEERCKRLAELAGLEEKRLLGWCVAFASMTALELASNANSSAVQLEALLVLASRAE